MSARTKLVAGLAAASVTLVGCGKKEEAYVPPVQPDPGIAVRSDNPSSQVLSTITLDKRFNNGFDATTFVVQATADKYCIVTIAGANNGGVAQSCFDGTATRPGAASGAALATPER